MAPAATETITVVRRSRDRNGDPTASASHDISGCVVQPRDGNGTGGNERTFTQSTVISGLSVWAPPGTDLLASDAVTYHGHSYEVEGEPGVYRSFVTGTDLGVYVALQRVTG